MPAPTSPTSESVRAEIVEALKLDLVGPDNAQAFAHELLPDGPSRWYMCGFLVPSSAPTEQKSDETSANEIDSGDDTKAADDAAPPDRATARKSLPPSSMGLSVRFAPGVDVLEAQVAWGDYLYEGAVEPGDALPTTATAAELHDKPVSVQSEEKAEGQDDGQGVASPRGCRREPREEAISIALPKSGGQPMEFPVPNSGGLTISVTVRAVPAAGQAGSRLPAGTCSVSVFLVNNRPPNEDRHYRAFAFQTSLTLSSSKPFVARPDLRGAVAGELADEWEYQVADIQYRDVFEYAVGHGVSATGECTASSVCHTVQTTWISTAEVEKVSPAKIPDVELNVAVLGALTSHADAQTKLSPLVTHYRTWIAAQQAKAQSSNLDERQTQTAQAMLQNATHAANRIQAGIDVLADPQVLEEVQSVNNQQLFLSRFYNYGLALISQVQAVSGTVSYFGTDGHGSTRFLTDTNGNITDTYAYDAYGLLIASMGSTPNNYLYCGQQWDGDLGMYYLRAR